MARALNIPMILARPWRLLPEFDVLGDDACASALARAQGFKVRACAAGLLAAFVAGIAGFLGAGAVAEWTLGRHSAWLDGETEAGRLLLVVQGSLALLLALAAAGASYMALVRATLRRQGARGFFETGGEGRVGVQPGQRHSLPPSCPRAEAGLAERPRPPDYAGRESADDRRPLPLASNLVAGALLSVPCIILLGVWMLTDWEWSGMYALLWALMVLLVLLSLNFGRRCTVVVGAGLAMALIAAWVVTGRDPLLPLAGGVLLLLLHDAQAAARRGAGASSEECAAAH